MSLLPVLEGISIVTGLLGGLFGIGESSWADRENINIQKANLQNEIDWQNYQKSLQQTMFNREDNAVQRRVADLKAAGLSPVLAAGQGAQAGPVVQTGAPQRETINLKTPQMLATLAPMFADISRTVAQTQLIKQQIKNESLGYQGALYDNLLKKEALTAKKIDNELSQYNVDVQKTIPVPVRAGMDTASGILPGLGGLLNALNFFRKKPNKKVYIPKRR